MKLTKKERAFVLKGRNRKKVGLKSRFITSARKKSPMSKGEKKIWDFFKSERIYCRREYYFTGCYSPSSKHLLYFDFWVPDYNLCIEFDGEQHYSNGKTEAAAINDFTKNAYCLKNNINLLRIKHTDFDNIEKIICQKIDKINPV